MKTILVAALFALGLQAQNTFAVYPLVLNSTALKAFQGTPLAAFPPCIEVMIAETLGSNDGFRVAITGVDMAGKAFTLTKEQPADPYSPGTMAVFLVDAASLTSVKVTPYRLDPTKSVSVP